MPNQDKQFRWWDVPAILLLVAVILITATRLLSTGWTRHLDIVQIIALLGGILGFTLGYSQFSTRVSFLMSILYGLFIVLWQLGSILKDELIWAERINILLNRSSTIISQLLKQEAIQDSLLFLILMSVLFWVLGIYSSFNLIRKGNPWISIIPLGFTLLVIQAFDPQNSLGNWYIAAFFFFSLILIARMVFIQNKVKWRLDHTAVPPHLGMEIVRISIFLVLTVLILTWAAPALAKSIPAVEDAWRPVDEIWLIAQDKFSNAFASLQSTAGTVSEYYGKSALLGRGNPLNETRMFTARSKGELPEGYRLYWMARSYDQYLNGQWKSTDNETRVVNPEDTDLQFIYSKERMKRTFEIISATPMTTLFLPTQPVWVNRNSLVELIEFPDGVVDVSTIRASPDIDPGQAYTTQAALSYFSETQLRNANQEYPDWIVDRYLQIPETITPRTIELAKQITADQINPFDKAVAITEYLRNNIEYTDTVPPLPAGQEPIDWVLFELKQGFCNYYATAEVIMLRSIGIPARIAIGYAQGERLNEGEYLVRQSDAHAWPEAFFPIYGWVEFEPTALQPTLVRPKVIDPDLAEEVFSQGVEFEEPKPGEFLEDQNISSRDSGPYVLNENSLVSLRVLTVIASLGTASILFLLVWVFRDRIKIPPISIFLDRSIRRIGFQPPEKLQKWARRAALQPLAKAYQEINNALSRLGYKTEIADTPYRRGEILCQILPEAKSPVSFLIKEYQTGAFGMDSIDLENAKKAGSEIRRISYIRFFQKNIFNFSRKNS